MGTQAPVNMEHAQNTAESNAHLAWPGGFWRGCAEKCMPWGRSRLRSKRENWEPETLGGSLSSATCKLGSLRQSTSLQLVQVYTPVQWPDKTPCKMGTRQSSWAPPSTTSGVTLGCSRSLLAGVSSTAFWGGTSAFWQGTDTTWGCDSSPLAKSAPSKAGVTVWGTKGSLPEAGPAEALVASHFLYDKILQAPSLSHRFYSKPAFVDLHSIKMQTSLERAHNAPLPRPQPLLADSLYIRLSGVLKKARSEKVRRGKQGELEPQWEMFFPTSYFCTGLALICIFKLCLCGLF